MVDQLVSMGFAREGCRKAVYKTNNSGTEAAMNWVLEHMGDPGKLSSPHLCNIEDYTVASLKYGGGGPSLHE